MKMNKERNIQNNLIKWFRSNSQASLVREISVRVELSPRSFFSQDIIRILLAVSKKLIRLLPVCLDIKMRKQSINPCQIFYLSYYRNITRNLWKFSKIGKIWKKLAISQKSKKMTKSSLLNIKMVLSFESSIQFILWLKNLLQTHPFSFIAKFRITIMILILDI